MSAKASSGLIQTADIAMGASGIDELLIRAPISPAAFTYPKPRFELAETCYYFPKADALHDQIFPSQTKFLPSQTAIEPRKAVWIPLDFLGFFVRFRTFQRLTSRALRKLFLPTGRTRFLPFNRTRSPRSPRPQCIVSASASHAGLACHGPVKARRQNQLDTEFLKYCEQKTNKLARNARTVRASLHRDRRSQE